MHSTTIIDSLLASKIQEYNSDPKLQFINKTFMKSHHDLYDVNIHNILYKLKNIQINGMISDINLKNIIKYNKMISNGLESIKMQKHYIQLLAKDIDVSYTKEQSREWEYTEIINITMSWNTHIHICHKFYEDSYKDKQQNTYNITVESDLFTLKYYYWNATYGVYNGVDVRLADRVNSSYDMNIIKNDNKNIYNILDVLFRYYTDEGVNTRINGEQKFMKTLYPIYEKIGYLDEFKKCAKEFPNEDYIYYGVYDEDDSGDGLDIVDDEDDSGEDL
jgi:hypothetical protein